MHRIATEYEFCSAHFLPHVPEGHKCRRLHGHNYKLRVTIEGTPGTDGMLIDFFTLDQFTKPLVDSIDHRCLNDCGLPNPTAELIAQWFADSLADLLRRSVICRLYETPSCYAEAESP